MEIVLHTRRYSGKKVRFNSNREVGKLVEGTVTEVVKELNIVILRDIENFPHCVSIQSLKEI